MKIVPTLCNASSGDKELRVSQVVNGTRYVAVLVQRMAMIGERARLSGSESEGSSFGRGRRKVLMSLLVRAKNAGTRCHPSLSPGGYSTNVAGAHRIQRNPPGKRRPPIAPFRHPGPDFTHKMSSANAESRSELGAAVSRVAWRSQMCLVPRGID